MHGLPVVLFLILPPIRGGAKKMHLDDALNTKNNKQALQVQGEVFFWEISESFWNLKVLDMKYRGMDESYGMFSGDL